MLARHRSTQFHAGFQDVAAERLGPMPFI
jgi:hypothetical protein